MHNIIIIIFLYYSSCPSRVLTIGMFKNLSLKALGSKLGFGTDPIPNI